MTDFVKLRRAERAEVALRHSEARNRALLEASTDAIFLHTLAGRIVNCNPAACEIFGYHKSEMLALSVTALVPPETDAILPDIFREATITGRFFGENACRRKNGEVFPVEASLRQITVGSQNLIAAFIRDITERKWVETQLVIQRDLAFGLAGVTTLDAALSLCLEAGMRMGLLDCGGIYLAESPSGDLVLLKASNLTEVFQRAVWRMAAASPQTRLAREGRSVFTCYHESGLEILPGAEDPGLKALAVIPVLHQGELIACLNLGSHQRDEFSTAERNALEAIAAHMGHVVHRLRTERELRGRSSGSAEVAR